MPEQCGGSERGTRLAHAGVRRAEKVAPRRSLSSRRSDDATRESGDNRNKNSAAKTFGLLKSITLIIKMSSGIIFF